MHPWAAIDRYCQFHARWFESAEHYEPSSEHLAVYRDIMPSSWMLRRNGIWFVAEPPGDVALPSQGWKLHVSVRSRDSVAALRRLLPVLREAGAWFKFIVDPQMASLINGKLWPRGGSGKFLTVYPHSAEQFHQLGHRLTEEMRGFVGPYILSDRRWPGSMTVHYRYGGFSSQSRLLVDGRRQPVIATPDGSMVPDVRNAYWSPPDWVADPLPAQESSDGSAAGGLDNGRFTVTAALSFSNRGGVYEAHDNHTERKVILKEARPRVEVGGHHLDAIVLLEKEYRLLQQLASTGYYAQPVAWFREWEHAFLAEEVVTGDHLGRFTILQNPVYRGDLTVAALDGYLGRMCELWAQMARAIAAAHQRGIVLGDLSFTNVIVTKESEIRIIDLEAAVQDGVDQQVRLYTPGLSSPRAIESGISDRANDYHALGALMFGSVMLATNFTGFYRPAWRRLLKELTADFALSGELVAVIEELMEPSTPDALEGDHVTNRIQQLAPSGTMCRVTQTNRLALPAVHRLARGRRVQLRQRVGHAVDGVVQYLHGIADPSRSDRLFPADLMVFETNPVSVAYGAAGTLYAQHRMVGEVPLSQLAWLLRHSMSNDLYPPGLYVGQAGVAWVLSELGHMDLSVQIMRRARHHELLFTSPDVIHGAAGYGLACLKLWIAGAGQEFLDEAVRVGDHLLRSVVKDERGVHWGQRNGTVPLGYGYGASGIALFLLYLHLATGGPDPLHRGREALDFELRQAGWLAGRFAGFPAEVTEEPGQTLVLKSYWDAGSAGLGTTLVRYLAVAPDGLLEGWVHTLAADVSRKYVVFPQLFHGLAGLGNFLLDVWRQSGDERYLAEAWQVAEGVLLFRIERPEGIAFPGEQAMRESADLATGAAGVGLFLHRLLRAEDGIDDDNFNFVIDELLPSGTFGGVGSRLQGVR